MQEAAFANNAEWLKGAGNASDVVMSSRVRLARNIAGFPFTPQASRVDRAQILEACKTRILNMQTQSPTRFMWIDLHKVQREDRDLLVERQLMSRQHARGKLSDGQGGLDEPRGVAVLIPDERVSIMVNEEDHIRLQTMKSGLALGSCLSEANTYDDLIENGLDYAYHPRFGYLTACPTNVGTGLRLSVMLHLPGLKMSGELEKVRRAARDMGLAVRGFYGEGSESPGEFFQISNQTTLGKSDEMLLREMEQDIIPKIVGYERAARQNMLANRREILEDQAWRALGTLRYARSMKTEEAMELLSMTRFGVLSGLISDIAIDQIHTLLLATQPMHLQRTLGQALTQQQRRTARADLIRKKLGPPENGSPVARDA
ncbi:MAG: protein arginine kinase [bacterium]|nr:protein arginine kinase [bacterium]